MPVGFTMPRLSKNRNILRTLVARAIAPKIYFKLQDVTDALAGPINAAIAGFFGDLAHYMGHEADLASQLPAIPGIQAWVPLSAKYVRQKGNAAFWLYTAAPGNAAKLHADATVLAARSRKVSRAKVSKKARAAAAAQISSHALIPTLARLNGLQVFGGANVRASAKDRPDITFDELKTSVSRRVRTKSGETQMQTYLANAMRRDLSGVGFRVAARLWSALDDAGVDYRSYGPTLPVVDFMEETGAITAGTAVKLRFRADRRRPLIEPFMKYYSRYIIPAIVRQSLMDHFGPALRSGYAMGDAVDIKGYALNGGRGL